MAAAPTSRADVPPFAALRFGAASLLGDGMRLRRGGARTSVPPALRSSKAASFAAASAASASAALRRRDGFGLALRAARFEQLGHRRTELGGRLHGAHAGVIERAEIRSAAVPLPPATIAPAWPMRLPGNGAVTPAMYATTGFDT